MDIPVGRVMHYYDKIGVAIVSVENQAIKPGDTLKFSGHDQEFNQRVESIQMEHRKLTEAKPGMVVGIKTDKRVKEKDQVFLVSGT